MNSLLVGWLTSSPICTETMSVIRQMQPDTSVLSDDNAYFMAEQIEEAAKEHGINPRLLIVMAYGESRLSEDVVNTMQISATWNRNKDAPYYCQIARKSLAASINCGAYVLAKCAERFQDNELYLCWSGFHIEDKAAYLQRIRDRWDRIKG